MSSTSADGRRRGIGALGALGLLAVAVVLSTVKVMPDGPTTPGSGASETTFDLSAARLVPGTETSESVDVTADGYALPPNSSGRVRIPIEFPAFEGERTDARAVLELLADASGGLRQQFTVVARDGMRRELSHGGGAMHRFDVTAEALRGPFALEIRAVNGRDADALFLDQVTRRFEPTIDWPARGLLATWAMLLAAFAAMAIWRFTNLRLWSGAALLGVIAIAVGLRLDALHAAGTRRLFPDAIGYRRLADDMTSFYDTGFREPLWPALARVWFEIFGSQDVHLRALSVVVSVLLVVVVYRFALAYTASPLVATFAAGFVAVHDYLVDLGTEGLREDLYALLVVLIAHYVLASDTMLDPRARLVGLTVTVAAASLLRVTTLYFIPFVLAYGFLWSRRLTLAQAVVPVITAIALLIPHFAYQHDRFGDPFWSINVAANFYRNYEFVRQRNVGCDGCPTREQMKRNSSAGEQTTTLKYVFGMHSLGEVVVRTAEGLHKLFLTSSRYLLQLTLGQGVLVPFYWLGLLLTLLSRRRELLLFPLLSINFLAFVIPLGIDPRLVMHAAPFLDVIAALGVATLVTAGLRVWPAMEAGRASTRAQPDVVRSAR